MAHGVVLDTSFLITLADPLRERHKIAEQYWRYFKENGVTPFLSVIVVSEFEVKQRIPDEIRDSCVPLVFNMVDALQTAKFEKFREKEPKIERAAVKDDLKIIAQAAIQDAAFVITDDSESFSKYSRKLYDLGKVKFRTIVLKEGFNEGLFGVTRSLF